MGDDKAQYFGYGKIEVNENRKQLVFNVQHLNYAYRYNVENIRNKDDLYREDNMLALKNLSFIEFVAMFDIIEYKDAVQYKNQGRRNNLCFDFSESSGLFKVKMMRLRSKFYIPIISGNQ